MNWFSGWSTIVLSYMCHPNFVYVRAEMVAPTKRRVRKSISYALLIESVIYILMGTAGYLSTGDRLTPDLFVLRKGLKGRNDYFMQVDIFLFLFVGLIHIVLNLYPCREQAYAYFKIDSENSKIHWLFTFLIMLFSHLIIIVYPNILSLFGIAGAIFCSFIGWVIPYLMQIRLLDQKRFYQYPKNLYYLGFLTYLSKISLFQTDKSFIVLGSIYDKSQISAIYTLFLPDLNLRGPFASSSCSSLRKKSPWRPS